ncbi:MAG: glycosyltransferase family 2 protein [Bauldia sp.]|nr:glycosyltransferase family 2 protein [Bauldia sp.]
MTAHSRTEEAGAAPVEPPAGAPDLTVVVPTFNERDNIPILIGRLETALHGLRWEVVFVDDDSPDGTADVARELARRDGRVRVIQRIGRRGLSSACVEGILSSAAPVFAVMDADLQHDDTQLRPMVDRLAADELDIVVGSRYIAGGDTIGLSGRRKAISRLGTTLAQRLLGAELTDPMSGFFVMRRDAFNRSVRRLSQQGFKILLDIFASAERPLRYAEIACRFHPRVHGESKLDTMAAWEFGLLVLDKLFGRWLPTRFLLFSLVGGTGVVIHLVVLWLLGGAEAGGEAFFRAQTGAVAAAMTWNFFVNNWITYRDKRLRGWGLVRGLLSFYAIGAAGAVANVGVATLVASNGSVWWLAGLAGAAIGAVWNFAASNYITWRARI